MDESKLKIRLGHFRIECEDFFVFRGDISRNVWYALCKEKIDQIIFIILGYFLILIMLIIEFKAALKIKHKQSQGYIFVEFSLQLSASNPGY